MVNESLKIQNVVIVGTGLMGSGIAQVAIESGVNVTVVGRTQEKCVATKTKISTGLARSAKKKFADSAETQSQYVEAALSNLEFATELTDVNFSESDLVIEAIVENLKVKQKLFSDIEQVVSEKCIFATNTSSFQLKDISSKLDRQDNFAGLHFFNPVPSMKLVELVRGDETSDEVYNALFSFCQRLGKTPVRCKDTPGFIVNRLLIPYLLDAMKMVERGDAEISDIDTATKLGTGYPMGPFELLDYIGLDTMKFIVDGWHQRYPEDDKFAPCAMMDRLVSEGKLGKKTGEGFLKYNSDPKRA
uniref:3-hydroxyacyl-CoA dehydrogenase n=1 Tax=Acrobeloides nanus TaxID=290746 RepID=A0A914EP63_9BILA